MRSLSVIFLFLQCFWVNAETINDPIKIGITVGNTSFQKTILFLPDDGSFSGLNNENDDNQLLTVSILTKPHDNFTIELAYTDFGEFNSSNVSDGTGSTYTAGVVSQKASIDAITLSFGLEYKPRAKLNLFTKLGYYQSNISVSGDFSNGSGEYNGSVLSFGMERLINKDFGVKLEFSKYNDVGGDSAGINGFVDTTDIKTVALSLLYSF